MEFSSTSIVETLSSKLIRNILLMTALIISIMAYYYTVEVYVPTKNFFSQILLGIVQESYDFYSGSAGGYYIQIGQILDDETKEGAGIRVNNRISSGGLENAIKVMDNPASFGLLLEDTIQEGDFIGDDLNYISPLYLERMHILYRREVFEKITLPLLSPNNEDLKEAFSSARVSTGPQGSVSKIYASYLLNQCKIDLKIDESLPLVAAISKLKEQKLDVVFIIAGAPLPLVTEILKEYPDSIGLLSIKPELFQDMNKNYGLKLRPTTFEDIYEGGEKISTIGSYTFLIASKDVPDAAISELLYILDASKEKMKMKGYGQAKSFPLDQFDFRDHFKQKYIGFPIELIVNILMFLVSVSLTTAGALAFLVRISSGYKQSKYFRIIVQIYKNYLPENTELSEQHEPFPRPIIWEKQDEIITKLIRGISELLTLVRRIREDFETGGITISHYNHLLESAYSIRDIFLKNLAQRINEVIEGKRNDISSELLRHLYTAGYLRREDYQYLIIILKERGTKTKQK